MNRYIILILVFSFISFLIFLGCDKEEYPYYILGTDCAQFNKDIPPDPGGTPPALSLNNVIPSGVFTKDKCRIKVNMLGVIDPNNNLPITFVFNQNVFLTEDGILKGLKVTNLSGQTTLATDIVFTIDNSGSMGEEADSIAKKISEFIDYLHSKGLDVRVGVLGYIGQVNGGINLTTGENVKQFLNRPGRTGTLRTFGFMGPDSAKLYNAAIAYATNIVQENGIVAISFADSLFSWRSNATRVYINFTDEGIQPGGSYYFSLKGLKDRWTPAKGTIHQVYSIRESGWIGNVPDTTSEKENGVPWSSSYERPWLLAVITGGTIKFIHSDARDLDLTGLPVTGALTSSVLLEYVSKNPDVPHDVTIYVKHQNILDGKTEFKNLKY